MPKKYNLLTALKIVLRVETQRGRATVFQEIVNNNWRIRVVLAFYDGLRLESFQGILIFLYGLKCLLTINPPERAEYPIVATGFFPNEVRTIDDAEFLLGGIPFGRFTPGWSHLASIRSYSGARAMALRLPQLLRICRLLARRYSFMPACRGFSALMYAIFYQKRIRDIAPLAAVVASSYAPDAVGMAAAAHGADCKVIHFSHAFMARNADYVVPVYADLSVLSGPIVVETLRKKADLQGRILFRGIPVPPHPLRTRPLCRREHRLTVGVFLTGAVDAKGLHDLVCRIARTLAPERIYLRPHPVSLLHIDLDYLRAAVPELEVANSRRIDAHAQLCSFVICGNSSAALEVLKSGTPVLYNAELDKLPYDYCGFVGDGLIPEATVIEADVVPQLVAFYERPEWTSVTMQYDPFYARDPEEVRMGLRNALISWLWISGGGQADPEA